MTDVNIRATGADSRADLSALKLAELQALASSLGIVGATKLRKGDLVNAIEEHDNDNQGVTDAEFEAPQLQTWQPPADEAETPVEPAPEPISEPVAVKKRTSRRVTSADTEAIAAAPVLAGAPEVEVAESAAPSETADAVEVVESAPSRRRSSAAPVARADFATSLRGCLPCNARTARAPCGSNPSTAPTAAAPSCWTRTGFGRCRWTRPATVRAINASGSATGPFGPSRPRRPATRAG